MASVDVSVAVEGVDGVIAAVMAAERAILPPSITESLAIGADILLKAAQDYAPRLTDDLYESIKMEPDGPLAFTIAPGRGGMEIPYANTMEHGGERDSNALMIFDWKGKSYRAHHVTIPASPFMEPARAHYAEAYAAIAAAIYAQIRS